MLEVSQRYQICVIIAFLILMWTEEAVSVIFSFRTSTNPTWIHSLFAPGAHSLLGANRQIGPWPIRSLELYRCTSVPEKPTVLAGHLKYTDTMPFK